MRPEPQGANAPNSHSQEAGIRDHIRKIGNSPNRTLISELMITLVLEYWRQRNQYPYGERDQCGEKCDSTEFA